MKHIFTLTALLFFVASCNNASEPKPEQIAQTFLTAYFQLDYDQFLPMCGAKLRADLEQSAQTVRKLSLEAQKQLRDELSDYRFRIEDTELNATKDTVFVNYLVYIPDATQGLPGHLTMALEEKQWKVVKLVK
ncbi:MAG: hypothetical protein FWD56_02565 [Bacteroidales bacterium]|nr:hypothetical protein [Bacteroidales bacterium]